MIEQSLLLSGGPVQQLEEGVPRTTSNGSVSSPPSSAMSLGVQFHALTAPAMNSGPLPSQPSMCFISPSRYSAASPCGQ